jgi:hypothetical protein
MSLKAHWSKSIQSRGPARVDVRGLGRIGRYMRGVLVHAPTFRYRVGRYRRNVMLLVRGWWFRLVAVYLHEQLVNKIIQLFKLRCIWWRRDGSVVVPYSHVGHMCYGRLFAIVSV